MSHIRFELNDAEMSKYDAWRKEHIKTCPMFLLLKKFNEENYWSSDELRAVTQGRCNNWRFLILVSAPILNILANAANRAISLIMKTGKVTGAGEKSPAPVTYKI